MVCANFAHTTSLWRSSFNGFSRKERKARKGVGMGRRVSARPLAAPSGFARTLLGLCFAKLLASLVGGPDGFAAGASRAQATRRLPARANGARPRKPAGHVESPAAIRGGCTALGLETSSRPSRRIRRALSGSTCPPDTKTACAVHEQTRKSHATNWRRLQLVKISYKFISMAEATHVTFRLSFV